MLFLSASAGYDDRAYHAIGNCNLSDQRAADSQRTPHRCVLFRMTRCLRGAMQDSPTARVATGASSDIGVERATLRAA